MLTHTGTDHYRASFCADTCCINYPKVIMSHGYAAYNRADTQTCRKLNERHDAGKRMTTQCPTRCHTGLGCSRHVVYVKTTTVRLQTRPQPLEKQRKQQEAVDERQRSDFAAGSNLIR